MLYVPREGLGPDYDECRLLKKLAERGMKVQFEKKTELEARSEKWWGVLYGGREKRKA